MEREKKRRMIMVLSLAPALILASIGGLVLLLSPAAAQPAYVNSWSAGSSATTLSFPVTVATTAGDTVVVTIARKNTGCTVSTVTDNAAGGSSTYNSLVGPVSNTVGFNIYGTPIGAAKAATSVTVTMTGTACKVAVAVADYSGVTNYGNTNTGTGSGANPGPVAVTVQEASGAVVGGFATNDGSAQTSLTGTLRQAPVSTGGSASTRDGDSLVDQLNQAAGSVSIQTTHAAIAWAGGAVELRNQGTLISVSCTSGPTPLTANVTYYIQGVANYVRLTCTVDGKAYTTSGSIAATPTFTLPAPFTQLWSFFSTTATGTTCAAGSGAWQMTSGAQHTFGAASQGWDYCAVIPSSATADSTSFTVAWSSP